MPYYDQSPHAVRCEWGLHGVTMLADADVVIIVDVLSFTTSVEVAVSRGVKVLPYRWRDDTATNYARQHDAHLAVGRGHDDGWSLSPASLTTAPAGLRLVLPSPNGSTFAFEARDRGATVLAGCLRNAAAVARYAATIGQRITVIPAGERWPDGSLRPAIEDLIGAGAILAHLDGPRSPEAAAAIAAFHAAGPDLLTHLLTSTSGRELADCGYTRDVEIAAEFNCSTTVPILTDNAFVASS